MTKTKWKPSEKSIAELRDLADQTSKAALTAAPGHQDVVKNAAKKIDAFADGMERRRSAVAEAVPAVLVLPDLATNQELATARVKQSTRRGQDVFLPSWSSVARALPDAFLRTAVFSTSSSIQKSNAQVLAGDKSLLVANEVIASLNILSIIFSGYRLCQFDRQVYAACLDYYRERPLAPTNCTKHVGTSYHEFAGRLGATHNAKTYKAIRASLLRLSFAQIRMRRDSMDIEVPKLLSVHFDDGSATGELKGSDTLMLRVTESVAELFGVGSWTAIDQQVVSFDGLRGWLGSFYATHKGPKWLPVETLYKLSGYESKPSNFRDSLVKALDKLKEPETPECSRVEKYVFSKDQTKLRVILGRWPTHTAASV